MKHHAYDQPATRRVPVAIPTTPPPTRARPWRAASALPMPEQENANRPARAALVIECHRHGAAPGFYCWETLGAVCGDRVARALHYIDFPPPPTPPTTELEKRAAWRREHHAPRAKAAS